MNLHKRESICAYVMLIERQRGLIKGREGMEGVREDGRKRRGRKKS